MSRRNNAQTGKFVNDSSVILYQIIRKIYNITHMRHTISILIHKPIETMWTRYMNLMKIFSIGMKLHFYDRGPSSCQTI